MKWSFSTAKIFERCQRRWYYKSIAHHAAKDRIKREAYYLSQLKSVSAWRGSVVDQVIEQWIIPKLNQRKGLDEKELQTYAEKLMDTQFEFAKARKFRETGISKSDARDAYCALYEFEYEKGVDDNKLAKAKADVQRALTNLINSNLIREIQREEPGLLPQKRISIPFNEIFNLQGQPDLILIYQDNPPQIIDWKVHVWSQEHSLQLSIYGYLFARENFYDKFKVGYKNPVEYSYLEFQLLHNEPRPYTFTEQDFTRVEQYIAGSICKMEQAMQGKELNHLSRENYQKAYNNEDCATCPFKSLCEEKEKQLNLFTYMGRPKN